MTGELKTGTTPVITTVVGEDLFREFGNILFLVSIFLDTRQWPTKAWQPGFLLKVSWYCLSSWCCSSIVGVGKTNLCSLPLEETQTSVGVSVDPKGYCVSALSPLLFLFSPYPPLFDVLQTQSTI